MQTKKDVKTQWAQAFVTKVSCFVALLGYKTRHLRQSVTNLCPVVFRDNRNVMK